MNYVLFWHVVSYFEESVSRSKCHLCQLHQIQKYLGPISSMPCVCTLLYKKNQYRLKTSWTEHHPVRTEMPWTGKVVASMIQCFTKLTNPTWMLHYWIPGHGVNKRTLGQKHDLKNKLQNYSCSKWPNRLTLKHEWHIIVLLLEHSEWCACPFRFGPMSCYNQEHCIYSKAQISMSWIKKSSFLESVWFPNVLQEWLLPW